MLHHNSALANNGKIRKTLKSKTVETEIPRKCYIDLIWREQNGKVSGL